MDFQNSIKVELRRPRQTQRYVVESGSSLLEIAQELETRKDPTRILIGNNEIPKDHWASVIPKPESYVIIEYWKKQHAQP